MLLAADAIDIIILLLLFLLLLLLLQMIFLMMMRSLFLYVFFICIAAIAQEIKINLEEDRYIIFIYLYANSYICSAYGIESLW